MCVSVHALSTAHGSDTAENELSRSLETPQRGRQSGGEGLGRDYCIRGCWGGCCRGIGGQSCLAPAHSTVRVGGGAKPSSSRGGAPAQCVSERIDDFSKQTPLPEHTEFLRGRTAEPGSPWERLTTPWLSEAELNRPRSSGRVVEVPRRNLGKHNNLPRPVGAKYV